jgi:hydrogenase maturation protease
MRKNKPHAAFCRLPKLPFWAFAQKKWCFTSFLIVKNISAETRQIGIMNLARRWQSRKDKLQQMKTIVLGVGNPIMSDDGAGPYAAKLLASMVLPPEVDIDNIAVIGLNLLDFLEDYQRAFIVDCLVNSSYPADTVMRFTAGELKKKKKELYSHHNLNLINTLSFGRQNGLAMPEDIIVYAVCADNVTTFGEGLSHEVQQGAEKAARLILEEISAGT